MDAPKGPGERERLEEILKVLEQSHKSFFCDGIRYQVVSKREMELFLKFREIRKDMNQQHT